MTRLKALAVNLCLMAVSVALFLLVCELVVFRFVFPASDAPANAYVDGVVRYAPNQKGIWRIRDEVAAPYSINAQGWNSGVGDYELARKPGVPRIAIVGDSFVEALQVRHDRSLGEDLAADLAAAGRPTEVYRFGISGAPLSQYLHMVEREVVRYRPDWIVVMVVHNDFDESYGFKPGRYTSSFLKLKVADGRVLGEIPPTPWKPGPIEWLRRTATARFFLYRWQVRPAALADLILAPARADERYAANIEIGTVLAQRADIVAAADYLIGRLDAAAKRMGAHLLLAMDGDRQAIYAGDRDSPALELNRIAAAAAAHHGVPFIDLHPIFAADWAAHHRRFEHRSDYHWNQYGHSIVAAALARFIDAVPVPPATAQSAEPTD